MFNHEWTRMNTNTFEKPRIMQMTQMRSEVRGYRIGILKLARLPPHSPLPSRLYLLCRSSQCSIRAQRFGVRRLGAAFHTTTDHALESKRCLERIQLQKL